MNKTQIVLLAFQVLIMSAVMSVVLLWLRKAKKEKTKLWMERSTCETEWRDIPTEGK